MIVFLSGASSRAKFGTERGKTWHRSRGDQIFAMMLGS